MAFERRPPNARGGVPEVDLEVRARRRQRGAVGAPDDREEGQAWSRDRSDKPAGLRLDEAYGTADTPPLLFEDRNPGPVGAEGRLRGRRLAPSPAGPAGRQVVHE